MKEKEILEISPRGLHYIIAVCEAENERDDQKGMLFDVSEYFSGRRKYFNNQNIRQMSTTKLLNTYNCLTDDEKETILLIKLKEGEEKTVVWNECEGRETSIDILANKGSVSGVFMGAYKIREKINFGEEREL